MAMLNGELRAHLQLRPGRRRPGFSLTSIIFILVLFLAAATWLIGQRSVHWLLPNDPDAAAAAGTSVFPTDVRRGTAHTSRSSSRSKILLPSRHVGPTTPTGPTTQLAPSSSNGSNSSSASSASSNSSSIEDANIVLDPSKVAVVVQQSQQQKQQQQQQQAKEQEAGSDTKAANTSAPMDKSEATGAAGSQEDSAAHVANNVHNAERLAGLYGQGAGTVVFPSHTGLDSCPSGVPSPQSAIAAVFLSVDAGTPLDAFTAYVDQILAVYGGLPVDLRSQFHLIASLNGKDEALLHAASKYAYGSLGMVKVVQHAPAAAPGKPQGNSSSSSSGQQRLDAGGSSTRKPAAVAPGTAAKSSDVVDSSSSSSKKPLLRRLLASTYPPAVNASGVTNGTTNGTAQLYLQADHQMYLMHLGLNCLHYPSVLLLHQSMRVEPDMFGYFAATQWLLVSDPSLYCVSAWNEMGAQAAGAHPLGLLRTDHHPGRAWLIGKDMGRTLITAWQQRQAQKKPHSSSSSASSSSSKPGQPDDSLQELQLLLQEPGVRAGRQCIIPERPRVVVPAPPSVPPEPAVEPTTADELLNAAQAAANASSGSNSTANATLTSLTSSSSSDDGTNSSSTVGAAAADADTALQTAVLDVGGEVVAGEEGLGPPIPIAPFNITTVYQIRALEISNSTSNGSSSGSGGGAGAGLADLSLLDLSRVRWSERDLSGLLREQYQRYVAKLLMHSPDMDILAAANLLPPARARVWYSSLVEYAAAVKLLGVGGPSWELKKYCYRLPVLTPAGGNGQEQGKQACQEYQPLSGYNGLLLLRNPQGARVVLVPSTYQPVLPKQPPPTSISSSSSSSSSNSTSSGSSSSSSGSTGSSSSTGSGASGSKTTGAPSAAAP